MGSIGGLLGTSGGAGGTGFSNASQANIQNGVTTANTTAANQGVAGSLSGSQSLLAALQAQGGAQNQSTSYNQGQQQLAALTQNGVGEGTQDVAQYYNNALNGQLAGVNGTGAQSAAIQGTGALAGQLGAANGVGAQTSGIQGLQNTAAQLQGVANGTGPNPAMAALNQQTGQNVANQAALMAGQRGASSNVGLLARQAAQQGAATQQQAVGQAATLQSQQQLNAIGQEGAANQAVASAGANLTGQQAGVLGQQGSLGQAATAQQQAGINSQFNQGTQGIAQQQAQQQINAGIAQNQVANTLGANSQVVQGNLGNQSNVLGALGAQNSANVASQGSVNAANAGLASTTMQGQQGLAGGLLNAGGAALGLGAGAAAPAAAAAAAEGGIIIKPKKMADGGTAGTNAAVPFFNMGNGGGQNQSKQQNFNMGSGSGAQSLQTGMSGFASGFGKFLASVMQPDAEDASSDQVPMQSAQNAEPAPINVGEDLDPVGATAVPAYTPPGMASGGLAASGGHVVAKKESQKAEKKGNSYDNDKIPAMLSQGEIVLPRSVTMSSDPAGAAAKFVQALKAKGGRV